MHGEFGHVHLMIHRPYGTICLFLLKQMFEQPFRRRRRGTPGAFPHEPQQDSKTAIVTATTTLVSPSSVMAIITASPGVVRRSWSARYIALSASSNGSPLTTSSRTPKKSQAAPTRRTVGSARARASGREGSSKLLRLRLSQLSWAPAQLRSRCTATMR